MVKLSTFAIADTIEQKIRHRGSNRSVAAGMFKDAGCIYEDDRTVKIVNNSISILIQKFGKAKGRPGLTACSASLGRMTANVFGQDITTAKAIQIGDFLIDVFVKLDMVVLSREEYIERKSVTAWWKGEKYKKLITRAPWILEVGSRMDEISFDSRPRMGINAAPFNQWNKQGFRITDGVKERLVKSKVKLLPNYKNEQWFKAIEVLEKVKWSIDENVANIAYKFKDDLTNTMMIVQDKDGKDVPFDTKDIRLVGNNIHLKNRKLFRNELPFKPWKGNNSAAINAERKYKDLKKAGKDCIQEEKEYLIISGYWKDKRYCLRKSSKAARNNVILETVMGNDQEMGWLGSSFYMSYYCDYRGRVYARETYFSYQASDLSKGQLQFAKAKKVGNDGIEAIFIHTACSFNQSYSLKELAKLDLEFDYIKYLKKAGLGRLIS